MSLAEKFSRLFAGLERSHGIYVVPQGAKPNEEGKLHSRDWARTVAAPVTLPMWADHISGKIGLGIVPIRDDATCVFGAIDVDVYPLDLLELRKRIEDLNLPLIVCRTKSGGAHLYLFLQTSAPAELVRGKLMEWSVVLGFPGVEVFPKQTRLASEQDAGSWINIPYQAGDLSLRYAIGPEGTALTTAEFADLANDTAITPDELQALELPADATGGDWFEDAPPCLQTLAVRGFGTWNNTGTFNIAVYLRKRHGEGWEEHLAGYNREFMSAVMGGRELSGVIKSVNKKSYSYQCKQEPLCGVCNKQVCLTRKFGVGGMTDDPGVVFGELVKLETEPVTWLWDVNGARIELTSNDLMSQIKFHELAISKLSIWPTMVKASVWQEIVREKMVAALNVSVPAEGTKRGQFWAHVAKFCTSRVRGKSLDELLMGKPYTENGRTYFCSTDLIQYLAQHRFEGRNEKDVYKWLRDGGVMHHFGNIKGKGLNYWSVPAFPEQTEEHSVPRAPVPEKF